VNEQTIDYACPPFDEFNGHGSILAPYLPFSFPPAFTDVAQRKNDKSKRVENIPVHATNALPRR
jgi:hypothetical protein